MNHRPPYKWQPITDLPDTWRDMASIEMPPLVRVWEEQSKALRASEVYSEYILRMSREIAIETGVIERLYTLDRGVTQLLIEEGIDEALIPHGSTDRPISEVVSMIRDHQKALQGIFDFVADARHLSASFIKQLHQVLTAHQPYVEAIDQFGSISQVTHERGTWKRFPNNPKRPDGEIHEYAPPEQVASEMDNLINWHLQHAESGVSPEVEAAWLHHRFTQIHPFQDGNGRVARLLASLVFLRARWFPLVVTRDHRVTYIEALESADHGDLSPLTQLFVALQKKAFIKSLSLSEQVLADSRQPVSSIIAAVAETLRSRMSNERRDVEVLASHLQTLAVSRFQSVANELRQATQTIADIEAVVITGDNADQQRRGFNAFQVIDGARKLDYYANLREYHSWVLLRLAEFTNTTHAEILLSLHVLGKEYRGIFAGSVVAYWKDPSEGGAGKIARDITPLVDSPFQFSYADESSKLEERFRDWLEQALIAGLEFWRKGL